MALISLIQQHLTRVLFFMLIIGGNVFITGKTMANEPYEPAALLLTWQQDPTTTMTIDWHTIPGERRPLPPALLYRQDGTGDDWKKVPGTMHAFPYTSRTINRVELTGLKPGTTYQFRIGPPPSERYPFPESKTYKFRTMPAELDETIRFVKGGDTGRGSSTRSLAAMAAENDVEFVAVGGDLSYADGGDRDWRTSDGEFSYPEGDESKTRWVEWFEVFTDELVTDDGRVIPMLLGIGNHEVWRGYHSNHEQYIQTDDWRERIAPFYFNIFAFPGQPGYAAIDFADYLSMIFLDSGHANPIPGKQTGWLDRVLAERTGVTHIFPIYHIASYPTVRNYDGRFQTEIREYWAPLFERSNINVAFENHDHTYKRTYPIRNGEVVDDTEGIVYIGDGAFGRGEDGGSGGRRDRMYDVEETWYLKNANPYSHIIMVTLDPDGSSLFEAIRYDGEIMDRYQPPVR